MTPRALAVLASAAAALVCAPARAAGTLTVCTEAAPDGFDIVQYESAVTNDAAGLTIYDALLQFKPGTTELEPALAERWEISDDGLTYTLHLRRGVRFHETPWFKPTRAMNADDVVWSLERLRDKAHPAHASARNGYIYWNGMGMSELVRSVARVDDDTVRIVLSRPEAPLLANLAMSAIGSVYSAEYGRQLEKAGRLDALNTQPVGTGPFALARYQKDAVIRYTAHAGYWGGAPAIDRLVFAITTDPAVRVQRLKAGECLVGTNMRPESAGAFAGDASVQMLGANALLTSYVAMNTTHRFLDDRRFREALWLAIDKKTYVQSVYGGNATPAATFLPPGLWSRDASLADRHDPERARTLVQASGYDGTELALFTRIGGSIDGKRAAELLQADWGRIGVRVKIQMMEWGEMLKRTGQGDHDLTFLSWAGDNGDPDNFLTPNLSCAAVASGGNKSRWCHAPFDRLIDEARRSADPRRRTELYTQAQRVLYDEVGLIPLVYPTYFTAVNRRVQGFRQSPFAHDDFRRVRLLAP